MVLTEQMALMDLTVTGTDGNDGADGANGVSTLIRILSSTTCTTGGNSFEIGADNNGDGVLDITEVIVTVDICNGVAGPAGQDGADGNDGADGTNGTDGQDGAAGNVVLTVQMELMAKMVLGNAGADGNRLVLTVQMELMAKTGPMVLTANGTDGFDGTMVLTDKWN